MYGILNFLALARQHKAFENEQASQELEENIKSAEGIRREHNGCVRDSHKCEIDTNSDYSYVINYVHTVEETIDILLESRVNNLIFNAYKSHLSKS